MPAVVRMPTVLWTPARHSRGRGVLVGEPVHHTQAAPARSGVDACSSVDHCGWLATVSENLVLDFLIVQLLRLPSA